MRADSMKGITVHIGDYGWIECRKPEEEKYSGWFLRVKDGGRIKYVNLEDKSFTIPDPYIISSKEYDYVLQCKISAVEGINYEFNKHTKESILKEHYLLATKNEIQETLEDIEVTKNKLLALELRLLKLEDQENRINSGRFYKYVYGKHCATSKEYCWINDKGIDIKVGDTVIVRNTEGVDYIQVTRLENDYILRNHKSVICKA